MNPSPYGGDDTSYDKKKRKIEESKKKAKSTFAKLRSKRKRK